MGVAATLPELSEWTLIGLLKNWPVKFQPVIFGLLPYANEI